MNLIPIPIKDIVGKLTNYLIRLEDFLNFTLFSKKAKVISSDYLVDLLDNFILADNSSNDINITLPDNPVSGEYIRVYEITTTGGSYIVNVNYGSSSINLSNGYLYQFFKVNNQWYYFQL